MQLVFSSFLLVCRHSYEITTLGGCLHNKGRDHYLCFIVNKPDIIKLCE